MAMADVMRRLLAVRPLVGNEPPPNGGPTDELINTVTANEVLQLCAAAKQLFMQQGMMAELQPPAVVFGDFHGQLADLYRLTRAAPPMGETENNQQKYVFLGDYVDRGKQQLETILLCFGFKIIYPQQVYLVRGNHETANINGTGGFRAECMRRYPVCPQMWDTFNDAFSYMPVTALIGGKVLCMHGGLSPLLTSFDELRRIPPMREPAPNSLALDLMWSDPKQGSPGRIGDLPTWEPNRERCVSYYYGELAVNDLFRRNPDLKLVVRAHQCINDGYQWFANNRVLTIFSAPNYAGASNNQGAFLNIDTNWNFNLQQISVKSPMR